MAHSLDAATHRRRCRAGGSRDRRPTGGSADCRASPGVRWGLGLAPRGRARHVPASAHQPSGAERVAMAGKPRIEETCQGAHAQSWVKCPFLGTRLGHGAGGGRRPSSLPLTRRLYPPMSGHCASLTARFCQTLQASRHGTPRGQHDREDAHHSMPPSRRAPMAWSPGHGLCLGGKLTGNQVPEGRRQRSGVDRRCGGSFTGS